MSSIFLSPDKYDIIRLPNRSGQFNNEIVIDHNSITLLILTMLGLPNYDQLLFIIGLPAIWWLVLSYLSLDNKFIPRILVILGLMIGITLVIYLILFYQHNIDLLKWVFLFNSLLFLISIWSIFEFLVYQ